MNIHDTLANSIEEFESKINPETVMLISLDTDLGSDALNLMRNKLLTEIKSRFIISGGYINIPSLLAFCQVHGFTYGNVISLHTGASFNISVGKVTLLITG